MVTSNAENVVTSKAGNEVIKMSLSKINAKKLWTEAEKNDERYMRFSIMKRQNPSIKYPFRNPAYKCKKSGINTEYLCKICDWKTGNSAIYGGSIIFHIWKHRENGEW